MPLSKVADIRAVFSFRRLKLVHERMLRKGVLRLVSLFALPVRSPARERSRPGRQNVIFIQEQAGAD